MKLTCFKNNDLTQSEINMIEEAQNKVIKKLNEITIKIDNLNYRIINFVLGNTNVYELSNYFYFYKDIYWYNYILYRQIEDILFVSFFELSKGRIKQSDRCFINYAEYCDSEYGWEGWRINKDYVIRLIGRSWFKPISKYDLINIYEDFIKNETFKIINYINIQFRI